MVFIMSLREIISQGFGLVALLCFVTSFYFKTERKLLIAQTLYEVLIAIHLYLMNALTGSYLFIVCIIRDLLFIKYKNKFTVTLIIVLSLLSYVISGSRDISSLFIVLGSCLYTICLYIGNMQLIRLSIVVIDIPWVFYLINNKSYYSLICTAAEVIAGITSYFKYRNVKDEKIANEEG